MVTDTPTALALICRENVSNAEIPLLHPQASVPPYNGRCFVLPYGVV